MASDQHYLADESPEWNYEVGPSNTKVSLKTIGGIQTVGIWDGAYGFAFIAWAPLIKADKAKEELLKQYRFTKPWSELVAEGLVPPSLLEKPKPQGITREQYEGFGFGPVGPYAPGVSIAPARLPTSPAKDVLLIDQGPWDFDDTRNGVRLRPDGGGE